MKNFSENSVRLPSGHEIRRAVEIYLRHAYGSAPPAKALKFIPPDSFMPAEWLMSGIAEREPAGAPLDEVRSFSLRIGNAAYPNMKLRLSRTPKEGIFVLSVNSHDAFLHADPGALSGFAVHARRKNEWAR